MALTTTQKLKILIERSGLPLSEIALLSGMSRQQLHYLISRPDADPKISTVQKILSALNLDLCDLEKMDES